MDLILDATGSFSWVQGYYVGPVISLDARRPTLDQPHPIHGSSPQNPESDEVPTRTTNLGDPMDPLGLRRPLLGTRPGGLGLHSVRHRPTG